MRWLGRQWLALDSWLRGETWPAAWAIYFENMAPLLIEDAIKEMPTRLYVPAEFTPYDPKLATFGRQVRLVRDGGVLDIP